MASLPNPQNYSGLEIDTKIRDVKLIDNDLVFVDSAITVYKDGKEVNNGIVRAYVLRTTPLIMIPPALLIINDIHSTIGIVVGYDKYVLVKLPPNTPDYIIVNELIKEALNMGANDVIRVINIIDNKMKVNSTGTSS
ncbi:hypothetical protein [Vulcanisaeta distributa]|uniref:hypothetical protein n=1 Tax=Vulcanisaeta distributa TaxID=164451 RepID=UPI000B083B96|nr:hypothetical protein [Vulcanisaeta distributa]